MWIFSAFVFISSILCSEDTPLLETSMNWISEQVHPTKDLTDPESPLKHGEVEVTIENSNEKKIFIKELRVDFYQEPVDKLPHCEPEVQSVKKRLGSGKTLKVNFKFSPKKEILATFYYAKITAVTEYQGQPHSENLGFKKIDVLELPTKYFEVVEIISRVFVVMIFTVFIYGLYRAMRMVMGKVFPGMEKRISMKAKRFNNKKELKVEEWLPNHVNK